MNDIGFENKVKLLELISKNSDKNFIIIPSLDYGYPGGFIKLEGEKFNLYCNNVFTREVTCVEVTKDRLPDSGHFITEFWKD